MVEISVHQEIEAWRRQFEALGSQEVGRHLAVAVDKTAMAARDRFRNTMPQVLGRTVKGPGGLSGMFGKPSKYTVNAVQYSPVTFSKVGNDEIVSDVHINASQGVRNKDQSAYLKYQFGAGQQTRLPGDVGMADERIYIPQGFPLLLTQRMNLNPYYVGGRQHGGILRKLAARAARKGVDHKTAMRQMGREAAGVALSRKEWAAQPRDLMGPDHFQRRQESLLGRTGHDRALSDVGDMSAKGIRAANKRFLKSTDVAPTWDVFEGPDRKTGLPTFFARNPRMRDPSGGHTTFRRPDGTIGKFPRTIGYAPQYGERGQQVGPRALLWALPSTNYDPKLQAPWDENNAWAAGEMLRQVEAEYRHAVERKNQGRSF